MIKKIYKELKNMNDFTKEEAELVWRIIRNAFPHRPREEQRILLIVNTKLLSTGFEVDE